MGADVWTYYNSKTVKSSESKNIFDFVKCAALNG